MVLYEMGLILRASSKVLARLTPFSHFMMKNLGGHGCDTPTNIVVRDGFGRFADGDRKSRTTRASLSNALAHGVPHERTVSQKMIFVRNLINNNRYFFFYFHGSPSIVKRLDADCLKMDEDIVRATILKKD